MSFPFDPLRAILRISPPALLVASLLAFPAAMADRSMQHSRFEIGEKSFLLDGEPFVIRSGEMHFSRIPREYWQHRLKMARAMGCNTVCAYLFWNIHEPQQGTFDFTDANDVAEYCRIAHHEGLKVILRPGPYACAEWDFGGFPWWLLKHENIRLRTRDPVYLDACRRFLHEVGKQLASQQITRGGPIIMVQVENEYGSYGSDRKYIGLLRDYLVEAGFEVPLFTCDGPVQLKDGTRPDIFSSVNFGANPAHAFQALRNIRPTGPLMCGEYYPGWFDRWGVPHRTGPTPKILRELGWMLDNKASFSIYMAHGGTSFGFTAGANSPPFRPQITSYDYDAPISEAGWATPKYHAIRELFAKHLLPGETLPDVPPPNPVIYIPEIHLTERAALLSRLPSAKSGVRPLPMEMHDQAHGLILYRKRLQARPATLLRVNGAHDLTFAYLDGKPAGILDRRLDQNQIVLPALEHETVLDLLVHSYGRINYGKNIHDRKGITGKVELIRGNDASELRSWTTYNFPLLENELKDLRFSNEIPQEHGPVFHRGTFTLEKTGDTFLDLRGWGRGVVWVNGRNLGRYWNLGPQQTLYCPGPWLKHGENEIVVLALEAVKRDSLVSLSQPVLDEINSEPSSRGPRVAGTLQLDGLKPVHQGRFADGIEMQTTLFPPTKGRYICLQALNSHPGDPHATCAELYLLDAAGREIPREAWSIVHATSEDLSDNGNAENVFDLQPTTIWHSRWRGVKPRHPHAIVIDLGAVREVAALRYLPRQDMPNGRIKDYRVFLSIEPFPGLAR